jgi:hypothetical protein
MSVNFVGIDGVIKKKSVKEAKYLSRYSCYVSYAGVLVSNIVTETGNLD